MYGKLNNITLFELVLLIQSIVKWAKKSQLRFT